MFQSKSDGMKKVSQVKSIHQESISISTTTRTTRRVVQKSHAAVQTDRLASGTDTIRFSFDVIYFGGRAHNSRTSANLEHNQCTTMLVINKVINFRSFVIISRYHPLLGEAVELERTAADYDPVPGGDPNPERCPGRSGKQGVRLLVGSPHTVGHRSAEGEYTTS